MNCATNVTASPMNYSMSQETIYEKKTTSGHSILPGGGTIS